jgi:hypothetical protein
MTASWPRLAFSVSLAVVCVAVLGARVYIDFERVRVRVVTAPRAAEGLSMTVPLRDQDRLDGRPIAVIVRIRGAAERTDVSVALDGRPLVQATVPANSEVRIDTSIDIVPGTAREVTVSASRPGWALTYLELATVHGYAGAPLPLVVAPHTAAPDGVLPLWGLLLLFVALILLRPRPAWPARRGRLLYRIAAALVLLLLAVTLIVPVFTPYKVLLSLQAFLLCTAVLYAEPMSRVWQRLRPQWQRLRPRLLETGGTPEGSPLPGWREVLLASAGLAVIVAVVLHVQVADLYGVPDLGDPLFSMWRIAWVLHQLGTDPRHLFDANIFYPARHTLTYSDSIILPALTAWPLLRAGLHPVVAYNLLLLSAFVLSGIATYVLARSFGWGAIAAWTSAIIFAIYPFRLDHYSHLELQMAQWMPLALLATHRLMMAGGWRYVALTALALGAQWYSSMYYAVFLSVYVAVFALVLAVSWRQSRRFWLAVGAVVLGAGLALPLARAYSTSAQERPLGAIENLSATPADYLQPTAKSALYAEMNPEPGHAERQLFPGLAPVALGLTGAWPPLSPTRLALLISGLVAFDGSLGMNGGSYPWLHKSLFPVRSLRVPARFAMLVGLTLALLSGAAVERWRHRLERRRLTSLAIAVLTAGIVADAWPKLRLVPVWRTPPPIYAPLGPSSDTVLMEYPLNPDPNAFPENIPFLYFSIWHLTPMVNGYSGFSSDGYPELAKAMEDFPGGETVAYLKRTGVTHISVICALDGTFGAYGVPEGDRPKCAKTIDTLDADPRVRPVIRADWEGAPALLYEIQR